ncbi:MAG: acylphosphatase [Atopobiaceae bacterium]|nr:acylphosphatase [Atopobiaceae bacterium]
MIHAQEEELRRTHVVFTGDVQGVGFRWACQQLAGIDQITGWIKNLPDGSVEAELQGTPDHIARFHGNVFNRFKRYNISFTYESNDIELVEGERDFRIVR